MRAYDPVPQMERVRVPVCAPPSCLHASPADSFSPFPESIARHLMPMSMSITVRVVFWFCRDIVVVNDICRERDDRCTETWEHVSVGLVDQPTILWKQAADQNQTVQTQVGPHT